MTAPERGTAALAPELARHAGHLARSLVAAGCHWSTHPAGHPAVHTSSDRRFRYAVEEALDPDAAAVSPPAPL